MLTFYNTLSRKKETFKPLRKSRVGLYVCGPTVYDYPHIGNMRAYVFADVLRRVLEWNDYGVVHVMNITDVGHLTSDADEGEDKLQKSAREQKTTAWEISKKYTKKFLDDVSKLNIKPVHVLCKATDHILEQIEFVKKLEQKGFTYVTSDGVYYDTSKFPGYGNLAKLDVQGLEAGKRTEMREKKNKTDFALWKFSKPRKISEILRGKPGEKRDMEWDSPWGRGFPGWHIECSAMSMKYLGETFDIHTGGIEHIPVHHTNEIAQSEAATGKPFVRYWLHHEHLLVDGKKMSKSLGTFVTLDEVAEKGFEPLALRYLFLTAHYRSPLNFTWESLQAAQTALNSLREHVSSGHPTSQTLSSSRTSDVQTLKEKFREIVGDDLDTPKALAYIWELIRSHPRESATSLHPRLSASIIDFDRVFGLNLAQGRSDLVELGDLPAEVRALVEEREVLRKAGKWEEADRLREKINNSGYEIEDTPEGPRIRSLL